MSSSDVKARKISLAEDSWLKTVENGGQRPT